MALPQREGRPALDISPDATPTTAGWAEKYPDPMNPCNEAVPVRKGAPAVNGWQDDYVRVELTSANVPKDGKENA